MHIFQVQTNHLGLFLHTCFFSRYQLPSPPFLSLRTSIEFCIARFKLLHCCCVYLVLCGYSQLPLYCSRCQIVFGDCALSKAVSWPAVRSFGCISLLFLKFFYCLQQQQQLKRETAFKSFFKWNLCHTVDSLKYSSCNKFAFNCFIYVKKCGVRKCWRK